MTEATLKPGWRKWRFDQIATNVNERIDNPSESDFEYYVGLEHIDPDSLKLRRWGSPSDVEATKLIFRKGDIIFGKRRVYQRKVAIAEFDGICSAHALVLRAKPEVVLPEFLPFFMQSDLFMERAQSISVGSLSPTINWKTLAKEEFFLPSREKQKQFVRVLDSVRNKHEALLQLQIKTEELHNSYILNVLNDLVTVVQEVSLGDVADVQYGLTVNKKRRSSDQKSPYLRVANIHRDELDLSEVKTIGTLFGDETYALQKGDVLVIEGHADPNEVGRSAVWPYDDIEMLHQNHLIRVRANDQLLPNYLCSFINSPFGRRYFRAYAKSTSGLNTLNSTVVRQLKIPLPGLDDQTTIVQNRLSFRSANDRIQMRLKKLNSIRHLLLNQLKGS